MGYDPLPEDLEEVDCHFNLSEPLPSCVPNSVQLICDEWCQKNCVQITIQNARTIYLRLRCHLNANIQRALQLVIRRCRKYMKDTPFDHSCFYKQKKHEQILYRLLRSLEPVWFLSRETTLLAWCYSMYHLDNRPLLSSLLATLLNCAFP